MKSLISVDYVADITIYQEGIARRIRNSPHLSWEKVNQSDSPFANWQPFKIECYVDPRSHIYIGMFVDGYYDREDYVFLHVYPNVPMWLLEKNVERLIKEIVGEGEVEIRIPDYLHAVSRGALKIAGLGK